MKIRVTSISVPGVGSAISEVTTYIEDCLRVELAHKDYGGGIQQFSVFYVSVDSGPCINQPFCNKHNRLGKYKDIVTGKMVSYIGIAIPIDPVRVLGLSKEELRRVLKELLIEHIEYPAYQLPNKFDLQQFLMDIKAILDRGT